MRFLLKRVTKNRLAYHFFTKKITIARWRLNLFGLICLTLGLVGGTYLTLSNIIPRIFAADTTQDWTFSSAGDYSLSDSALIEVAASSAKLKVRNYSSDANTALLLHLDESSGNPDDSSSNDNTATANTIAYTSGNLNNGASFDGNGGRITIADSTSLSFSGENTIEAWTKFDSAFSAGSHTQRQGIVDKGDYQLYYDLETGKITYELANSSANSWTQVAGQELNNSWDLDGPLSADTSVFIGSNYYVGLGNATGDAEVWRWNGSTWSKIGGDGVNSSWAAATYENVMALSTDGTDLYAGIGTTAGDGEVWKYTVASNTWTKIGGDATNGSWPVNTIEGIYSMTYANSIIYVGLGASASDAEVWSTSTTSIAWTKIGGDSTFGGWTTNYDYVYSLTQDGTYLYAGLGATAGEAEVWRTSLSSIAWTKIGGDAANSSWADTTYEYVLSLITLNNKVYAGLGTTANDAEVWSYDTASNVWTQIGGDSLNSGWTTNYEGVYNLQTDGTDIYAGLGSTGGDNEIWKYTVASGTWSKIGGDGVNSGFTGSAHTYIGSMRFSGSTLYASLISGNVGKTSEVWTFNGTSWTQIGGNYVNSSWGFRGLQTVEVLTVSGDKLYAGTGQTVAGNGLVWEYDGSTWTLIGGQGINSSWAKDTYERIASMVSHKGALYVGLGSSANDGEVWKWNGSSWSQIGGDSLKSGWTTNYEEVNALATMGDNLYAGLGASASDAEVWSYSVTSDVWTKIGGDSINSGWTTNYDRVVSLGVYNGQLYAGLGSTAGESEIWAFNGSSWSKVGGDTLNSSWDSTNYEHVETLIPYNGKLIAGLGTSTGDAEIWEYNGSSWTKIGGDDVNSSWTDGTYERVRTMAVYNGDLYVGLGNGTGEGEAWVYNGSTWSQMGGDSLNSGWTNAIEEVQSFSAYKGKFYVGLGNSQNVDALVYSYGNNAYLQATTATQNTNWHHVAATYNGSTMKIFIDGTQDNSTSSSVTIPDSNRQVIIGATYAGREAGRGAGYFQGLLDEIRISTTARTSFNATPYTADAQTVRPTSAVLTSQIHTWDGFSTSETANGGTITYRLSSDGGTTWKYWDGDSWETSASAAQANSVSTINSNIGSFTVGSGGILWQAVLDGNGNQQVTLNSVTVSATSDNTAPTTPSSLTALSNSSGSAISSSVWYNHTAPYFSWSGATDTGGSGVAGYYVYFGTDNTADPVTAGTFQTGANFTASNMVSGSTYYLRIKTKDNAQNTSSVWTPFIYKFDNTEPTNPSALTVSPAGYTSTNSYTFSWPSSGNGSGSDSGSGIAGYQYKTGAGSGTYSDWSATSSSTSITVDSIAYQTDANVFYLRTVDNAGNITATPVQINFYYAGEGPSAPRFLTATPQENTSNSFAFSWTDPETFAGNAADLTFCYTVNTLPSSSSCTFTSAGANSLAAGAFATQLGLNTFYLVAKTGSDAGNAINYANYASVTFTANTSSPGIPLNLDIGDVSIKSTSSWRLALSWTEPESVGSGISKYEIHRSTDASSYSLISTTTGLAYIDTGLDQEDYYYKVRACDSVNNCGEFSSAVTMLPTGRYTEAANLTSGPSVSGVTTKKASITWTTDRESDSKVQYGTSPGTYFSSEPSNSTQTTSHTISLNSLQPGTKYYYKVKWTDEDGNTGTSSEKTFTTNPAPTVQDVGAKNVSLDSAIIQFTSNGASKVKVYYGPTTNFGQAKEVATASDQATYTTQLEDLKDGTKYYFRINTFDADNSEYEGTILDFTTLPRPKISEVKIQQVKGTAQPMVQVSWETNTEVSSIATIYPEGKPDDSRDEVNVQLVKGEHKLIIRALQSQTTYILVVKGRDKIGNEASSDPQRFTTATDTRAPQILDLQVEGSSIPKTNNQDASAQLVVSWTTDELSTSQVEFGEGTGTTYAQKTQEESNLKTNHLVVITNLTPSKVYHLRAISKDKDGNVSNSVDTTTITPKSSESALNIVITNLQKAFGFLKGVSF